MVVLEPETSNAGYLDPLGLTVLGPEPCEAKFLEAEALNIWILGPLGVYAYSELR